MRLEDGSEAVRGNLMESVQGQGPCTNRCLHEKVKTSSFENSGGVVITSETWEPVSIYTITRTKNTTGSIQWAGTPGSTISGDTRLLQRARSWEARPGIVAGLYPIYKYETKTSSWNKTCDTTCNV
jgi:hypothetical protein